MNPPMWDLRLSQNQQHTQLADIFTKVLGAKKFGVIPIKLDIQDLHAPPEGY